MIAYEGFTRRPIEATFVSNSAIPLENAKLYFNGHAFVATKVIISPTCTVTLKIGQNLKPETP